MEPKELRKALDMINAIVRRDLRYNSVSGKQIIGALLKELSIPFAPKGGLFYQILQGVANTARRKSLLINPNENGTYSTAVGNTARMYPSVTGWEMTKGILSRQIHDARKWIRSQLPKRVSPPPRNFGW